ncbi:hypothetical protein DFH11DRAFT_1637293 [Phellopilus nigrolimitatus]|nr:hypothetical protein DFH11DRAFT_1637293 [Phellopilus nigrolimitatus]
MASRIRSHGKLAGSSVYFALTKTGKTGIYFSGDADYKPVFFYSAQPSTGGAGGCQTGYMLDIGETREAFEHAGFQLRSTINLHETPPSAIELRAFRQIANKWGFEDIENGVEYAAPSKWLAAYLAIFFENEDKELEGLAEALIKRGAAAKPGSVLPFSAALPSRRTFWQKIRYREYWLNMLCCNDA